jgi:hypothetical protein
MKNYRRAVFALWTFYSKLVFGEHNEASGPGFRLIILECSADMLEQSIRTWFTQSNQQEARMSAGLKLSSVREIQVLRNKESAFLLGRNPDIGIRLAG